MNARQSPLWNGGLVVAALLGMADAARAADVAGTRAAIDRGLDAQYSHLDALYKDIHSIPSSASRRRGRRPGSPRRCGRWASR